MLKKCEALLAQLKESLKLAQEIQKHQGTHNLDVMQIEAAIQVVGLRIGYLKKLEDQAAAKKKDAKKPATNGDGAAPAGPMQAPAAEQQPPVEQPAATETQS